MTQVSTTFTHRSYLDGLRGVAILAVIVFHAWPWLLPGGAFGVDIFFVLSGYLITSLIDEESRMHGRIDFKRFYIRRALRLLPALFLMLAFYGFVTGFRDHVAMLVVLLYAANWWRAYVADIGALGHTWSLSIEEQFYMLWPMIFAVFIVKLKRPAHVLLLAALAVMVYRLAMTFVFPSYRIYNGLDTRADALLVGCCCALAGRARLSSWLGAGSALILAGLLFGVPLRVCESLGFVPLSLAAFASGGLILSLERAPGGRLARALSFPPLNWIGKLSYGLYLWHLPIMVLPEFEHVRMPLKFAATFACASLSFYLLERPCLRLKNHYRQIPVSAIEQLSVDQSETEGYHAINDTGAREALPFTQ
ncbi:MAG: acyltransferase family protein [Blastocatellia bacterium]